MPAIPMNDAADKYSPEMADAFHPTETERPATKKSPVVLDWRADQKPIAIVTTTVTKEKANTQASKETVVLKRFNVNMISGGCCCLGRRRRFHAGRFFLLKADGTLDEKPGDGPDQREK